MARPKKEVIQAVSENEAFSFVDVAGQSFLVSVFASYVSVDNDGTDAASVCDRLYPDIRDSVLTTYPWTFNTKKVQLAQLITTPNSVWRYEYQLPGDRLGTVRAAYRKI